MKVNPVSDAIEAGVKVLAITAAVYAAAVVIFWVLGPSARANGVLPGDPVARILEYGFAGWALVIAACLGWKATAGNAPAGRAVAGALCGWILATGLSMNMPSLGAGSMLLAAVIGAIAHASSGSTAAVAAPQPPETRAVR